MDFSLLEKQILSLPDRQAGPGASPDDIAAAEQSLGLDIAGGYRRFIERFGWLGIGVIEIYGVGKGVPKHMNVVEITLSEREEMHPRLPHDLLPVMNDGGGNLYCIDTSSANGEIVFWDHDSNADQQPEVVSSSFEEWLYEKLDHV